MGILWELRQQRKIHEAGAAAASSATQAGTLSIQIDRLEQRVQKLTTFSEALWSLIQEQTELTDEDLLARVKELQAANTTPEGQPKAAPCPKCGRPIQGGGNHCIYCGAAARPETVVEKLP